MNTVFSHADLVFLTVPDDAIATCAAHLTPQTGQALVHCSGASEVELLAPAAQHGAQIGGFHPLFLFAGLDDDAARMSGSAVTIEADAPLNGALHGLAGAIGCRALSIPPGQRMRYHAGANYAASFLLCLLDEATQLWKAIGMPENDAQEAMWPLVMGTLNAARERGLSGALAGPVSRGDAGIVARHTEALASLGGNHATLYSLLTLRAIHLARQRPNADNAALDAIAHAIAPYLPPFPPESGA
ncbi:NADP oxidoreductase [Pandoraea bronchicola]|uniref:NADP oxidoreductase n=2 Tax=Pandoraea bronchicola TaxID=2508287 RepID=A0A5E5BTS4_9BURK|nr:NADP oxidoreductase [Pandoraea bronchicola]